MLCLTPVQLAAAQPQPAACPPIPSSQGAPAPGAPQPAPAGAQPTPAQIVACVAATPITGATFKHWSDVARKAATPAPTRVETADSPLVSEVMRFLISSDWVLSEAHELHIALSEARVRRTFDRIRHAQFRRQGEFRKFLRRSGQTVADLLLRVRLNLLSARIQQQVVAGHRGARSQQQALSRFVGEFKARWMAQTYCEPAYAVADCGHVQASL